jgi:chemotaxis protein CheD
MRSLRLEPVVLAERAIDHDVLYVEPGQLTVCTEPRVLRTILGSCVSVCLYDPTLIHGGMNHFMLPQAPTRDETSFRYGDRAMTALVERLARLGSEPRQLCASVYGGARVLVDFPDVLHLGRNNVEFAMSWLSRAGITVVDSGVLGGRARKLDFDVASGSCTATVLGGP